jgi:ribosomal protein L29
MKKTAETEEIRKQPLAELEKLRGSLRAEIIMEKAKLVSDGQKNSLKTRILRKKAARVETRISQVLLEKISEMEK